MRYLSVCSGIEAASCAWHPLGWQPLAFSELAAFPRKVLAHHYPDVPLHGDFTQLRDQPWIGAADLLVGGTPCQSFSVAGLRGSLSDERGNLTIEFVRLADAIDDLRSPDDPAWILWENVPGVLSTPDNAFGAFLGGLAGCESALVNAGAWPGAGVVAGPRRVVAWRTLDAQYFGVAQRRRRVFVLARGRAAPCGGWSAADALLPIADSRSRNPAPRRQAGQSTAGNLASRASGGGFSGTDEACDGYVQPVKEASPDAISRCLTRGYGQRNDTETESFVVAFHPTQDPIHSADGTTHALGCGFSGGQDPVVPWPAEIAPTLNAQFGSKQGLEDQHIHGGAGLFVPVASATPCAVRRLTPTECERLQGFPDGWTDITPGKTADGPRYKALGNSMAVPVMAWIGRRIAEVSK